MRERRKGLTAGRVAPKGPGATVWLVTWDWDGDHAKPEWDYIEAILSPHLSAKRVQWFVEQCYMQRGYTMRERLVCATHRRPNPYPAKFADRWEGRIFCGPNPFLMARKVRRFRVHGEDGPVTWDEIPVPESVLRMWAETDAPQDTGASEALKASSPLAERLGVADRALVRNRAMAATEAMDAPQDTDASGPEDS
jgi:hypothetical protein